MPFSSLRPGGKAACVAIFALIAAVSSSAAQDVVLQSRDGSLSVPGTLLSYDGEFYRIESEFGPLTLDAQAIDCLGPGCPDLLTFVPEVIVSGPHTLGATLLPSLLADFATQNELHAESFSDIGAQVITLHAARQDRALARFIVETADSAAGLEALRAGAADIALSHLALREQGFRTRSIALDAFVPVVGQENTLPAVSLSDLTAIMAGGITSWAALGGPELPIRVHLRDADSGVQQALESLVLAPLGLRVVPDAVRHATDQALAAAVAADPLGIGLSVMSAVGSARAIPFRGACGLVREATPLAVKAGDYPLVLPVLVVTRAERLPLQARRFIAYLGGAEAQAVAAKAGFIDQATEAVALSAQGLRLANAIAAAGDDTPLEELQRLVAALQGSARLSPTFRFESGRRSLTPQSETYVALLAEALESGRFAGREIVFAGFTDGDGSAAGNLRLARDRAQAVRRAVLDAAPLFDPETALLSIDAFGEAMPMDCDDTEAGRQVNRRVEIWLR